MKRSFPQRRPILFVVLLFLLVLITFFLAGAITLQLKLSQSTMTLMADGVLALIALFLLSRLHWWREQDFVCQQIHALCGSLLFLACRSSSIWLTLASVTQG